MLYDYLGTYAQLPVIFHLLSIKISIEGHVLIIPPSEISRCKALPCTFFILEIVPGRHVTNRRTKCLADSPGLFYFADYDYGTSPLAFVPNMPGIVSITIQKF